MSHATLVMKATRLCNLRCAYCKDWRTGPGQIMSFEVLATSIRKALEDRQHDEVQFVWHGGETTLLPTGFYEKALFLQSKYKRPGQIVHNVLQTNATRMSPEWIRFIRNNRFAVGVSIDGPAHIHDRSRVYVSGRGSHADVLAGIAKLRDEGLPVSVLMVVTREVLELGATAILDFFLESGIRNFGLLAVTPTNDPDAATGTPVGHYVSPSEMNGLLADLYDLRLARGLSETVDIRELNTLEEKIATALTVSCRLAGKCLGKHYIVEPDGEVAHCDLFLGDSAYEFGNILDINFEEIRSSPAMYQLRQAERGRLEKLSECPEFSTCQGWCPHERYLSERHNVSHTKHCCGLRPLIEHIRHGRHNAGLRNVGG